MSTSRYYPLAIEALVELASEIQEEGSSAAQTILPTLDNVLEELGPIPSGTLFIGMADDGLPILLNLNDSIPGSIMIMGDRKSGKTNLLKNIANVIMRMFAPQNLQFGVITPNPSEWFALETSKHCAAIIPVYEKKSMDFILSLNAWAHANRARQSVILLLDGLEKINSWNDSAIDDLMWLLEHGPTKRVWPIASLSSENIHQSNFILPYFRTFILGAIKDKKALESATGLQANVLDSLYDGSEFAMRENNEWIKFWIPRSS